MANAQILKLSPTTLKILINEWPALREIMAEITTTRKQRQVQNPNDTLFVLLTDEQVHNAFFGPYHGLVQTLAEAYVLISKLRTHLTISQDENIKGFIKSTQIDLPESIKTDINAASLDKLQYQLDKIAREHFAQWQEQEINWRQQVIMQLTMNEVNLSDLEINELTQPETLSEVLNLFTDLNLEPPKLKTDYYTFSDFLHCKAIICIHSALSRQHKPHSMEEIEKPLKRLKNDFKQINNEQNELLKAVKRDTDGIIKELQK